MKKSLLFLMFFLFPFVAKAYTLCDYTSYNEALKKAANVNTILTYQFIEEKPTFEITIYNVLEDQTIQDETSKKTYTYKQTNNGVLIISNITTAGIYKFTIYSSKNTCNLDALTTLYVEVPTYNKYYKDEACKGIESYKLCQRWSTVSISYEDFIKDIDEYKKSFDKEVIDEEEYQTFIEYLFEFYLKYYYFILPTIIVISVTIIIVLKKKENKFNI